MSQEYCQEFKPTIWFKINKYLFPYAQRPQIEDDKRTYLTTTVHIYVDWLDRLRLLVSGKANIIVVTYTDVEVKSAESVSSFEVQGLN